MHETLREYCLNIKKVFPRYFKNIDVLDVGSYDCNGNNRYLFENCNYLGIDVSKGNNVDIVSLGHKFLSNKRYDTVISTECFEHDLYYEETIKNIVFNLLKPNGMFLFSCATTGRPEHGTLRSDPEGAPLLKENKECDPNYYKNLTEFDFRKVINFDIYFNFFEFNEYAPTCLAGFGIKRKVL